MPPAERVLHLQSAVLGDVVLWQPLPLQLVAVADHLQVSPAPHVEGRVPAHANLKYRFATANLRKVPHDLIQVGSRHS